MSQAERFHLPPGWYWWRVEYKTGRHPNIKVRRTSVKAQTRQEAIAIATKEYGHKGAWGFSCSNTEPVRPTGDIK